MNAKNNEIQRLESISQNSKYSFGASRTMVEYSFNVLKRYLPRGGGYSLLEMGPAEGVMTDHLAQIVNDLTIVEGSDLFVKNLKEKYPNADIYCSLFESFKSTKKFDVIVMGHVLEHVENPVEILTKSKEWLTPNGIIFAAVPNSHSIHRQAAVLMGLQEAENSMSELDIHHGHRRVYNIEEFKSDFIKSGLNIKHIGGYWLKPLSNKQIEDAWTPEMLEAFMKLGEQYPDIAAEIYVVACI